MASSHLGQKAEVLVSYNSIFLNVIIIINAYLKSIHVYPPEKNPSAENDTFLWNLFI